LQQESNKLQPKIGLALSGGGVRAMAFHAGVLLYLAENNKLELITEISSVSGGTLFIGQLLAINNWKWPNSEQYIKIVYPKVKEYLTSVSLQNTSIKLLLHPKNWRYLLSRANVVSQGIELIWNVSAKLSQLPTTPIWSINGTTAETGRRFRFKQDTCGDYELGYAASNFFKVADAMAVSAAFPLGIGPFSIKSSNFVWKKKPNWQSSDTSAKEVKLPYKRLHLYDGGIYDNLGVEPLFDIGTHKFKSESNFIIVSDAGLPLSREFTNNPFNPFRLKRIMDIAMDQTRALRIRSIVNFLKSNSNKGVYLQIGSDPTSMIEKYKGFNLDSAKNLRSKKWLEEVNITTIANYPTNLAKIKMKDFEQISLHGYETANWNEKLFSNQSL